MVCSDETSWCIFNQKKGLKFQPTLMCAHILLCTALFLYQLHWLRRRFVKCTHSNEDSISQAYHNDKLCFSPEHLSNKNIHIYSKQKKNTRLLSTEKNWTDFDFFQISMANLRHKSNIQNVHFKVGLEPNRMLIYCCSQKKMSD